MACPLVKFSGKYASSDGKCLINNGKLISFSPGTNEPFSYSIPEDVTIIGDYTFLTYSNLQNITLHNDIISIGNEAFYGCISLQTVISKANSAPTLGNDVFYGNSVNNILKVSKGSKSSYESSSWKSYFSSIVEID